MVFTTFQPHGRRHRLADFATPALRAASHMAPYVAIPCGTSGGSAPASKASQKRAEQYALQAMQRQGRGFTTPGGRVGPGRRRESDARQNHHPLKHLSPGDWGLGVRIFSGGRLSVMRLRVGSLSLALARGESRS